MAVRFSRSVLCCLLLCFVSHSALVAQDSSSLADKLSALKENSQKLARLWAEQKIAYDEALKLSRKLEAELTEAQKSLTTSQQNLSLSQAEVQRLTLLLEQSSTTLRQLRVSLREESRRARLARVRSFVIGLVTGAVAGAVGYRLIVGGD